MITERSLFWTFWRWQIQLFSESKSWWKVNIYWLLKSSCFEFFGKGKYGLFLSKHFDGKMVFTCVFELLMIFQELGNMVLRELYHTNKKFYVTFLSLFCRFCCKNENTKKFFLLQSVSWSLKKLVFGSRGWRKYNIDF